MWCGRPSPADVLANICSTYQCLDCPSLFAKNADILSAIFRHIKEILTKDSWKHYPIYKQSLIWVIKCLKVGTRWGWLAGVIN